MNPLHPDLLRLPRSAFFGCLLGFVALPSDGFARGLDIGSAPGTRPISQGAISSPGETTALEENPAGLTINQGPVAQGAIFSGNKEFDPIGYGGSLLIGNGTVGAGVGISHLNGGGALMSSGDALRLRWGVAADIKPLNFALGVAGSHTLKSGAGDPYFDVGVILNPGGQQRIGITAFGLNSGVESIGGGFAYDVASSATITLDGTYTPDTRTLVAKPTLAISVEKIRVSAGYGFRASGSSESWLRRDFAAGLGYEFNHQVSLEAYYNQMAKYFIGLTFKL